MNQYKWAIPITTERTPVKPFIAKLPMLMVFIDSSYQIFEYDKRINKLVFMYQSCLIKK